MKYFSVTAGAESIVCCTSLTLAILVAGSYVPPIFGNLLAVICGVHGRVGNKQCSAEIPAPEIFFNGLYRADIGSIYQKNHFFNMR